MISEALILSKMLFKKVKCFIKKIMIQKVSVLYLKKKKKKKKQLRVESRILFNTSVSVTTLRFVGVDFSKLKMLVIVTSSPYMYCLRL